MLCKVVKLTLAILLVCIICMPVSLVFGTGIAILVALIGLAYISE